MRTEVRRPFLLAAVASLVVGSTLTAGGPVSKKGGSVNMHASRKDLNAALPPIDAAVPKGTETATFALG